MKRWNMHQEVTNSLRWNNRYLGNTALAMPRQLFISIVRKYNACQQLSIEEMFEIHEYIDLIDDDTFYRWKKTTIT